MKPSKIAVKAVMSHKNYRFMEPATVFALARKLDKQMLITSMTPAAAMVRKIRWTPKVAVSRHFLRYGILTIKLTGLTGSEQYAKLWSALGCWKLANKMQAKFNAQFTLTKRLSTWTPGRVLS